MIGILKRLFCEHDYKTVAMYDSSNTFSEVNATYYECPKCHKRKVVVTNGCYLKAFYKEQIKMWEKHEYQLRDSDVTWADSTFSNPTVQHLEKCLKLEYKDKEA